MIHYCYAPFFSWNQWNASSNVFFVGGSWIHLHCRSPNFSCTSEVLNETWSVTANFPAQTRFLKTMRLGQIRQREAQLLLKPTQKGGGAWRLTMYPCSKQHLVPVQWWVVASVSFWHFHLYQEGDFATHLICLCQRLNWTQTFVHFTGIINTSIKSYSFPTIITSSNRSFPIASERSCGEGRFSLWTSERSNAGPDRESRRNYPKNLWKFNSHSSCCDNCEQLRHKFQCSWTICKSFWKLVCMWLVSNTIHPLEGPAACVVQWQQSLMRW